MNIEYLKTIMKFFILYVCPVKYPSKNKKLTVLTS